MYVSSVNSIAISTRSQQRGAHLKSKDLFCHNSQINVSRTSFLTINAERQIGQGQDGMLFKVRFSLAIWISSNRTGPPDSSSIRSSRSSFSFVKWLSDRPLELKKLTFKDSFGYYKKTKIKKYELSVLQV